ncbi:MAG: cytidylate kinase-like family protein [Chloroflexota bacterium]|nr:cytidylate kinase-like family protein [Chloroflexota bacterium]
MPVITINGPIGSGSFEVGQLVAERLGIDYVDRMVLAEAARRIGSPVGNLVEKEQRIIPFRERLGRFLQTMLERSAISGVGGEPYFGHGTEMLPAETYTELLGESPSATQTVNDKAFIEATSAVITELAGSGNVVIIGRAGNMILSDFPGALHVGMLAPLESRIENIMAREHYDREEAARFVAELEQARIAFFRKFFGVNANDSELFHLVLNAARIRPEVSAEMVVHAVEDLMHSAESVPAV